MFGPVLPILLYGGVTAWMFWLAKDSTSSRADEPILDDEEPIGGGSTIDPKLPPLPPPPPLPEGRIVQGIDLAYTPDPIDFVTSPPPGTPIPATIQARRAGIMEPPRTYRGSVVFGTERFGRCPVTGAVRCGFAVVALDPQVTREFDPMRSELEGFLVARRGTITFVDPSATRGESVPGDLPPPPPPPLNPDRVP